MNWEIGTDIYTVLGRAAGAGVVSHSVVPILRDPTDYSPPGSFVHGISQARILEWAAILFARGSS